MLKKLSTALALGLVVALLSIPAASFAGKGTPNPSGDKDGIPDLLCEHGVVIEGVCVPFELTTTTEGNFDVAMGPYGPKDGGIPDLKCVHGEDSINPACWDAITPEENFDVAARRDNADPDCDNPIGTPWWMNV